MSQFGIITLLGSNTLIVFHLYLLSVLAINFFSLLSHVRSIYTQ